MRYLTIAVLAVLCGVGGCGKQNGQPPGAALFPSSAETYRKEAIGAWVSQGDARFSLNLLDGGVWNLSEVNGANTVSGTWKVSDTGALALTHSMGAFGGSVNATSLTLQLPDETTVFVPKADFIKSIPPLNNASIVATLFGNYSHLCTKRRHIGVVMFTAADAQQWATDIHNLLGDVYVVAGQNGQATTYKLPSGSADSTVDIIAPDPNNYIAGNGGSASYCAEWVPKPDFDSFSVQDTSLGVKQVTYMFKYVPTPFNQNVAASAYAAKVETQWYEQPNQQVTATFTFAGGRWQLTSS
jgi:hypothetical protein